MKKTFGLVGLGALLLLTSCSTADSNGLPKSSTAETTGISTPTACAPTGAVIDYAPDPAFDRSTVKGAIEERAASAAKAPEANLFYYDRILADPAAQYPTGVNGGDVVTEGMTDKITVRVVLAGDAYLVDGYSLECL